MLIKILAEQGEIVILQNAPLLKHIFCFCTAMNNVEEKRREEYLI